MRHLSLETIARLVDELPDTDEVQHLERCDLCCRELEHLRNDRARLAALPPIEPPGHAWPLLESRLARVRLSGRTRTVAPSHLLRAAAAVAIFFVGALAGVAWKGADRGTPGDSVVLEALLTGRVPEDRQTFLQYVNEAELLYIDAASRMAELQSAEEVADPYARLAALEGILRITGAALGQQPGDVVLNGYHVNALAQRDATLRRLAVAGNGTWF